MEKAALERSTDVTNLPGAGSVLKEEPTEGLDNKNIIGKAIEENEIEEALNKDSNEKAEKEKQAALSMQHEIEEAAGETDIGNSRDHDKYIKSAIDDQSAAEDLQKAEAPPCHDVHEVDEYGKSSLHSLMEDTETEGIINSVEKGT